MEMYIKMERIMNIKIKMEMYINKIKIERVFCCVNYKNSIGIKLNIYPCTIQW